MNRNVDEMIRLFQRATDAGIWTPQEASRHEARLEVLRAKLNEAFRELIAMRKRVDTGRLSERTRHPQAKQST
jgi:hypothetical protein